MDLIAIFQTLWKYKVLTLIMALATVAGCGAVITLIPPVYEAESSYLLIEPPPAPTDAEIAANPALGRINADNPYLRFSDPSVIINVVARRVTEDSQREKLIAKGASNKFEVTPSSRYGFSSPIIDVQVEAPNADQALKTIDLVGAAVQDQLRRVQAAEQVSAKYMISTRTVEAPDKATQRASGKLRALIGVLGIGVVLTMVMLSTLAGRDRRRRERENPQQTSQDAWLDPRYPADRAAPVGQPSARPVGSAPQAWTEPAWPGDTRRPQPSAAPAPANRPSQPRPDRQLERPVSARRPGPGAGPARPAAGSSGTRQPANGFPGTSTLPETPAAGGPLPRLDPRSQPGGRVVPSLRAPVRRNDAPAPGGNGVVNGNGGSHVNGGSNGAGPSGARVQRPSGGQPGPNGMQSRFDGPENSAFRDQPELDRTLSRQPGQQRPQRRPRDERT